MNSLLERHALLVHRLARAERENGRPLPPEELLLALVGIESLSRRWQQLLKHARDTTIEAVPQAPPNDDGSLLR